MSNVDIPLNDLLKGKDFDSDMNLTNGDCKSKTVILFYSPQCVHCVRLKPDYFIFMNEVIQRNLSKKKIVDIISKTNILDLTKRLSALSWNPFEVILATQVDDVGPADIILRSPRLGDLGLSVKFQNTCTLNVTGKHFLTEASILTLKRELNNSCEKYISEMKSEYGAVNNWFRKRKTSKETDLFIDKVRDLVILDWNNKTVQEKKNLLNKLVHADSPISFWVVKFVGRRNKFELDLNTSPIKKFDASAVHFTKESTSSVGFRLNNELFAKMQVKFNNGILEKAKGNTCDYICEGMKMKAGDAFGSWNFSI